MKILFGNWKMNPQSEVEAVKLARASDVKNAVLIPPFPFLKAVKNVLKNASVGAQDVFYEEKGAFTGEVSPEMLKKLGVKYVVIGHSERRRLGENDEVIAKKVKVGIHAGLKVILCVGEPLSVYKKGKKATEEFIKKQLKFVKDKKNLIIAYEPIWAVGTGKNADPEDAACVARFIKNIVSVPVLYGGSTNSKNAEGFLRKKEIAGLLIGGASIDAKEFQKMIKIAKQL
ncbi:MAG: triose-phosphate isomerase [Patescibacteria group bacterium]